MCQLSKTPHTYFWTSDGSRSVALLRRTRESIWMRLLLMRNARSGSGSGRAQLLIGGQFGFVCICSDVMVIQLTPPDATCSMREWKITLERLWSLSSGFRARRRAESTYSSCGGLRVLSVQTAVTQAPWFGWPLVVGWSARRVATRHPLLRARFFKIHASRSCSGFVRFGTYPVKRTAPVR